MMVMRPHKPYRGYIIYCFCCCFFRQMVQTHGDRHIFHSESFSLLTITVRVMEIYHLHCNYFRSAPNVPFDLILASSNWCIMLISPDFRGMELSLWRPKYWLNVNTFNSFEQYFFLICNACEDLGNAIWFSFPVCRNGDDTKPTMLTVCCHGMCWRFPDF